MSVPPSSTYRLQFSAETTFTDAVDLLPYLGALGVGALYASPLLESGAGSNHGYDVVDPTRVSVERGGEEGRSALMAAVRMVAAIDREASAPEDVKLTVGLFQVKPNAVKRSRDSAARRARRRRFMRYLLSESLPTA